MFHVIEYRGIDRLSETLPFWTDGSAGVDVDSRSRRYAELLQTGDFETEPRILIASFGDRILGMLPLIQRRVPARFGTTRLVSNGCECRGIVMPPIGANPALTWLAVLRWLKVQRRTWDALDLLAGGDPMRRRLQNAMKLAGLRYDWHRCGTTCDGEPVMQVLHRRGWRLLSRTTAFEDRRAHMS